MIDVLGFLSLALTTVSLVILIVLLRKDPNPKLLAVENRFVGLEKGQDRIDQSIHDEVATNRNEFSASMKAFTDSVLSRLFDIGNAQNSQLERFSGQITELTRANEGKLDKVRDTMNDGIRALQVDGNVSSKQSREEISSSLRQLQDSLLSRMTEVCHLQKNQFDGFSQNLTALTQTNDKMLEKLRGTVEERLASMQEENGKKLEQMRATVDEKLHATLEQRLGQSFQLVSERLELVHKGLGEMQTLASGVGDLKKVLTNVRARGAWGEVQLATLLDQILTKEQYLENVVTKKGSNERVEFAIRLPGQKGSGRC